MDTVDSSPAPDDRTIDPAEQAFYAGLAETWWDPEGPFWPLHRLNELRVAWIRDRLCERLGRDPATARPLQGIAILDVGCGGGILSEAMARLGASVTGVDVVERNIAVARAHAAKGGLALDYRLAPAAELLAAGESFDVVLNMEVVEHVADLPGFMRETCGLVRAGGFQFVATINRNPLAGLVAILGAEYVLRWLPRGTHQYRKLVKPRELESLLAAGGHAVEARTGVFVNPFTRRLHRVRGEAVNYMLLARRVASDPARDEDADG